MSPFRTKQKVVFIGRLPFCHIRPDDAMTSRHHITIAVHTDSVTVHAMETRNGTYVNGKKVINHDEVEAKPGDIIMCGVCGFVFTFEQCADGTIDLVISDAHEHLLKKAPKE